MLFATHFKRYLQIFIGCLLSGIAMNIFLIPAHLLSGGLSGIAIILYYLFKLPIGIQLIIYNLPIIYLAYKVFGKLYAVDTIIGMTLFSVCIDATRFLGNYNLVDDRMLCAIFGGVLSGIGYGLIFRAVSNTGGLDVIGAVIKKYYSFDVGTAIFALNFIVILIGVFIFDFKTGLFTLICMYASAEITNKVVAGFNRKKSITIMSPKVEQMAPLIMQYLNRGVTFFRGEGAFTRQPKNIMFVVVSLTQVGKIKSIVYALDPSAFMIISDTSEVAGRGFTMKNVLPHEIIDNLNIDIDDDDNDDDE
ncbi:YitT family protein [Pectinatus sottacetonis]|uniref:YitT family protein n=1 Tax=Pectinatus sottacetonis TaxID=1002795 RepID=UPI0018C68B2B|nr:YitT family protein [Pectinatus sottacetonis]